MTTQPLPYSAYVDGFLKMKARQRCEKTIATYNNALKKLLAGLAAHGVDPAATPPTAVREIDVIEWTFEQTADMSPKTESIVLAAAAGLFEYMAADDVPLNLSRIHLLIKQRQRKITRTLPVYPEDELERLIQYADSLKDTPLDDTKEHMRALRDRALIITLADSGLRIFEACNLLRGHIDMNRGLAQVRGKGDKDAMVRLSSRSVAAIRDYLAYRTKFVDGVSGKPLRSIPVFIRHDRGSNPRKIEAMETNTGRNIVNDRAKECFGNNDAGLHPHLLRHRFVTRILEQTGNIRLAQILARHENIGVTQIYAHIVDAKVDEEYTKIFEQ